MCVFLLSAALSFAVGIVGFFAETDSDGEELAWVIPVPHAEKSPALTWSIPVSPAGPPKMKDFERGDAVAVHWSIPVDNEVKAPPKPVPKVDDKVGCKDGCDCDCPLCTCAAAKPKTLEEAIGRRLPYAHAFDAVGRLKCAAIVAHRVDEKTAEYWRSEAVIRKMLFAVAGPTEKFERPGVYILTHDAASNAVIVMASMHRFTADGAAYVESAAPSRRMVCENGQCRWVE